MCVCFAEFVSKWNPRCLIIVSVWKLLNRVWLRSSFGQNMIISWSNFCVTKTAEHVTRLESERTWNSCSLSCTLRVWNVLIDNIFHHIYVPLSLGLIASVDLRFSQIWLKMCTLLCLTGASILESSTRKQWGRMAVLMQIVSLRRFGVPAFLTDETKGWWKNLYNF